MFFDKNWHGISNLEWTQKYHKENLIPKFPDLIKNEIFFNYDCELTYPVSGAFTEYLINRFGIELYKKVYADFDTFRTDVFVKYFNKTLNELEEEFFNTIS